MFGSNTLTFGEVVKHLISEKKATKTSVAKELGFTDVAVHRLINNVSSPTLNRALAVLDVFGYTLAVIPDGVDLPAGSVFLRHAETEAERGKKKSDSGDKEKEA